MTREKVEGRLLVWYPMFLESRAILNFDTLTRARDRVLTSLWFVPGLITLGSLTLAWLTPVIDGAIPNDWLQEIPLIYSGRPVGARAVLSTIATSMITIAGVVFSMTIVSLQLASSQFGPRLLRTFLRDRGNQVVLGTFVGIFVYCILVLPSIDARGETDVVPHIAVTVAVIYAVVGLAMLVYFIDHVAQSIHADAVIDSVGRELEGVIDQLYPEPLGKGQVPEVAESDFKKATCGKSAAVLADRCGYLSFINGDSLLSVCSEHDLYVRVEVLPGRFVLEEDLLASVWCRGALTGEVTAQLRNVFVLGAHRTTLQDTAFAFEQLTEMAVRALSPGINDPITAIHCADRIGAGLARLVQRRLPSRSRRAPDGQTRMLAEPVRLEAILTIAVQPIAANAGHHSAVWLRLLDILEGVLTRARREEDRRSILECARRIQRCALDAIRVAEDRAKIEKALSWTREAPPLDGQGNLKASS